MDGVFKWSTSVTAMNATGTASAYTIGEWYDRLVYSGTTAYSVTFNYALRGNSGAVGHNTLDKSKICAYNYMQVNAGPTGYLYALDTNQPNWAGGHCGDATNWDLAGSTTAVLNPNQNFFDFSVFGFGRSSFFEVTDVTGSAWGGFASTGGITGITFNDASGNVLSGVNYSFVNGTTFYNPNASTVPEPSTGVLLLIGLVGVAGVARKRVKG